MTPANRLARIFAGSARGRRLVIPYVCAGDPDAVTSASVLRALGNAGAEIVELGIPFGDAVGDGGTIAGSAHRALRAGMTLAGVLDLCANVRDGPAIVLFGYLNPIARYGVERFAADAARAGVAGVIVADLPYEDRSLLTGALHARGIASILLVSPATPGDRAARIAEASDVFVYLVSRLGVTGAGREPDFDALACQIQSLRVRTNRPIAVGFGISRPRQVAGIAAHAEAIVVGSALVDALAGRSGTDAAAAAVAFFAPLAAAARDSGNEIHAIGAAPEFSEREAYLLTE
jgi:tryptophan synthase alpha chain